MSTLISKKRKECDWCSSLHNISLSFMAGSILNNERLIELRKTKSSLAGDFDDSSCRSALALDVDYTKVTVP